MQPIPSHLRWYIGNPEYILLKAGLFEVNGSEVVATPSLIYRCPFFESMPERLLPLFIEIAEICAVELGGALDTDTRRRHVTWHLRETGMRPVDMGELFVQVAAGARIAADERRNQKPLPR